ncbi:hypothetical protein [Roseobacter ponti]|uniref:Secreted protein n=1 Tax=Roseobacter ponti TaxID=1891787 RepID=A0A858SYA0_9RHOB|nr:hypothetical protein [Roseobacter ponti]QJF52633.1 hypothetical protein G3256_16380 [Roseobacter ponti]
MKHLALFISVFVFAGPALSQDWALRDSDRTLSADEVDTLTAGRTLVFYDDGRSAYGPGDTYSYTYAGGQSAPGRYSIAADGTVCIAYLNGFSRCDRYVESAGRIVLLTEDGERYPVRPAQK